ncbi:Gas vesicle structural protein [Streptomyces hirsutus]
MTELDHRYPGPGTEPYGPPSGSLADLLERVLDKGIVIAGDIKIDLLDIELLTIRLRLFIASVDTAKKAGIDWWETDPALSSRAARDALAEENARLRERLAGDRPPAGGRPSAGDRPSTQGGPVTGLRYVYAVCRPFGAPLQAQLAGVAGDPPRLLTHHGLVAVVSHVPEADFEEPFHAHLEDLDWLTTVARAHQGVIDALTTVTTPLPLRLGTVFRDDSGVRRSWRRARRASCGRWPGWTAGSNGA